MLGRMGAAASLLRDQLDYYRARAGEYDEWWLRQGRYDRGAEANARWFAEAADVRAALEAFQPKGRVLEIAGGTGIWTEQLRSHAGELTVLDGSPEMLAINAARNGSRGVRYVEADVFAWRPTETYDVVFFSFWLSHVPPARFAEFWALVETCLAPGGRVFFVDSRHEPTSTALDHRLPTPEATVLLRRLNDGREFQICKVFYDPTELRRSLARQGWACDVRLTPTYFLHGACRLLRT